MTGERILGALSVALIAIIGYFGSIMFGKMIYDVEPRLREVERAVSVLTVRVDRFDPPKRP